MSPSAPPTRSPRHWWWLLGLALAAGVMFADHALWKATLAHDIEHVKTRDWWQWLRCAGYLPTWIALGLVIALADLAADARRWRGPGRGGCTRGVLIALVPAACGLAAEIVKVLVRRQRPGEDGLYHFDWAGHGIAGLGLGLPSSHAAVAFGGAAVVGALVPGARWPLLLLAAGCAWSRVVVGAHFASDCVVAALISYALTLGVLRWLGAGPRMSA